MKKMMFLMLALLIMGAASMNAQVQIGGTNGPDKSAILDLNPDAGDAKGGLALPRVALTADDQKLNNETPQPGTVVYNTSSTLAGEGTYVWTKVDGAGTAFTGISTNNAGTNTTIGGTGTPASPLTVNVDANGITATQLANNAVTTDKIAALNVTGAKIQNATIVPSKISSNPGDAGLILKANGSSASWEVNTPTHVDSTSVVKLTTVASTVNMSVVLVYAGTINVTLPAGAWVRYGAVGLSKDDWCTSAYYDIDIRANDGRVVIKRENPDTYKGPVSFKCWRAV